MSAKGHITGNDAADRILREEVPCSEAALLRVLAAERMRTIASLRGRLSRRNEGSSQLPAFVLEILDEMEEAS